MRVVLKNVREAFALLRQHLADADMGQIQQAIQALTVERASLGSPLHFDILAGIGHNDVHIDGCFGVFLVGQIEAFLAMDHPPRRRRQAIRCKA